MQTNFTGTDYFFRSIYEEGTGEIVVVKKSDCRYTLSNRIVLSSKKNTWYEYEMYVLSSQIDVGQLLYRDDSKTNRTLSCIFFLYVVLKHAFLYAT